ncbi:hypothetical protein L9F63_011077, partial [Diploptera punctata]
FSSFLNYFCYFLNLYFFFAIYSTYFFSSLNCISMRKIILLSFILSEKSVPKYEKIELRENEKTKMCTLDCCISSLYTYKNQYFYLLKNTLNLKLPVEAKKKLKVV